jgi:hypothetical protein
MRGREPLVVWILFAVVAIEILVTYSRLPASELYHVSGSGLPLGAGRDVVFLNFPVALVAIAVVAVSFAHLSVRRRVLALAGVLLCLPVFWPGVVRQSNLDARWVNAIPAVGVLLVLVATLTTRRAPSDPRGDRIRVAVAAVVLVAALPWIAAEVGVFFPGPHVHHGHHHGMDGVLLVLTALLLSRRAYGLAACAFLAPMFTYGLGNIANDFWGEQVVARGWTTWAVPSVLEPRLTWAWAVVAGGAIAVLALWLLAYGRRPELREDVGHLEGAADGVGGTVDPRLALLDRLDGEHAEGNGHAGLDPGQLQA